MPEKSTNLVQTILSMVASGEIIIAIGGGGQKPLRFVLALTAFPRA